MVELKSKALREKAGEIQKKLDLLTLQCRQENRPASEDEQKQFLELRMEANKLLTEAEGYDILDNYEGEKLTKLRKSDVNFNSYVNTQSKADLNLAIRSWLGRELGIKNAEWDAHAQQLGFENKQIQTRAWSSTTSGSGSEFVPTTLGDNLLIKLKAFGGLLPWLMANGGVFETETGEPFNYPIFDPTGLSGGIITENSADSAETSLTSASKAFTSYCFTSGIQLVSYQAIMNSKFNIIDVLSQGLAQGLNRGIASYLITGTGSGQPEGILTNAVSGVTTASATAFTYNELEELMFSVDKAYADNGTWIVSRGAMSNLFALTDNYGRPLFLDNMRVGQPASLFGRPIVIDVNLPTVAATHTPIIFGDVAQGYKVRMVGDLMVRTSQDRYFEYNQTAVIANQFLDAHAVNTDCYRVLTMHS